MFNARAALRTSTESDQRSGRCKVNAKRVPATAQANCRPVWVRFVDTLALFAPEGEGVFYLFIVEAEVVGGYPNQLRGYGEWYRRQDGDRSRCVGGVRALTGPWGQGEWASALADVQANDLVAKEFDDGDGVSVEVGRAPAGTEEPVHCRIRVGQGSPAWAGVQAAVHAAPDQTFVVKGANEVGDRALGQPECTAQRRGCVRVSE